MASVRKEIQTTCDPDAVWDALRDFGALHERVVPGFVVDTQLEGTDRIVKFANGAVQREPLVDSDDEARRLVYSAVDSPIGATHYNASVQVFPEDGGSRVEWIVDVLPNELGPVLDAVMGQGAAAMKQTFDAAGG